MKLAIFLFSSFVFASSEQFLTTVHFAIREENPSLLERAQNLVLEQFSQTMGTHHSLSNRGYQVRTSGNEMILTLISGEDLRGPMQNAVSSMISSLNGKIQTRGGAHFYRTQLSGATGGILDIVTDESQILTINAQSVPLRDLLKELKHQVGNFSYLIPGECGERFVDWNFGNSESSPKSIDIALEELSVLFGLKLAKQSGTYIFSGNCREPIHRTDPNFPMTPPFLLPESTKAHVYFPRMPLAD